MLQAHGENHDCIRTTLVRSLSHAWIHQAQWLARRVESECRECQRKKFEAPDKWRQNEVEQKTAWDGIVWELVLIGQHHTSLAERRVAVVRNTLKHILDRIIITSKLVLGYTELQMILT